MKTLIFALTAFAGMSAFAQPMVSSNCPIAQKIRMPIGGNGFHMSADCKSVYVLPPSAGKITLEGVTESASLQRCPELKAVMRNLKEINKTLTSATMGKKEETEVSNEFDPYGPLTGPVRSTPVEVKPTLTDDELVSLLIKRKEITDRLMTDYGKISGVKASLLYSTGYSDYLDKVRTRNRHVNLNFEMLPLKNTKFTFVPSEASEFSAVLNSTFPSVATADAMNGSVSGTVELNLFGACPLTGASGTRLSPFVSTRKFAAELPAKLTYDYDLLSTVTYHAFLNRGGLAERIRDSSTRGGFFSSKSVSKLINKTRTDSWFTYTYTCNESRACEQAHDINVVELKSRLMDEVLSNIALVKFEYPLAPEGAAQPGRTGAEAGSAELKKCPHMYCQIAAGVLDVASATLGSSSKVDKYINDHRDSIEEKVTTNKAYPYTGTMGFASRDY